VLKLLHSQVVAIPAQLVWWLRLEQGFAGGCSCISNAGFLKPLGCVEAPTDQGVLGGGCLQISIQQPQPWQLHGENTRRANDACGRPGAWRSKGRLRCTRGRAHGQREGQLRAGDIRRLSSCVAGKVHGSLARAGKVRSQTPKVAPAEKKKVPKGRAFQRLKYNRRFVNVGAWLLCGKCSGLSGRWPEPAVW